MSRTNVYRRIDTIWKIESTRIIAGLTSMVRDIGFAEDLAHDALVVALEQWPETGIPDNPGAWLMTVAKRGAIDLMRRDKVRNRKYEELGYEMSLQVEPDYDNISHGDVSDDLLCLIFTTCHPLLSPDARVALTLRLFGGLTTKEIAHAYLLSESTIAQRIVRGKRTLAAAHVPFEIPKKSELSTRLSSVLEVIYLMFNEGYATTSGTNWIRPMLCGEALRLGRMIAEMLPNESEVHGLVALMEIQMSRFNARIGPNGESILLMDQNRVSWDHLLIRRGLTALEQAEKCGEALGHYSLQAAIAACHARAHDPLETDWVRISALYDALGQIAPSPVVELNRAVALSMAFGPAVGLEITQVLIEEPTLKNYYLLPSVRGDLLFKLGRFAEACEEFKRAASLTSNTRERELLLNRAANCVDGEM